MPQTQRLDQNPARSGRFAGSVWPRENDHKRIGHDVFSRSLVRQVRLQPLSALRERLRVQEQETAHLKALAEKQSQALQQETARREAETRELRQRMHEIGREFESGLLDAVSPLDSSDLSSAVDQLASEEILRPVEGSRSRLEIEPR